MVISGYYIAMDVDNIVTKDLFGWLMSYRFEHNPTISLTSLIFISPHSRETAMLLAGCQRRSSADSYMNEEDADKALKEQEENLRIFKERVQAGKLISSVGKLDQFSNLPNKLSPS